MPLSTGRPISYFTSDLGLSAGRCLKQWHGTKRSREHSNIGSEKVSTR